MTFKLTLKKKKLSKNRENFIVMALPVVEFSREGYKIRKGFGKKSTVVK